MDINNTEYFESAMMEVNSLSDIIKKANFLTEAPENYLSAQEKAASEIRELTKKLYDFNKLNELCNKGNIHILEELVVDNLDEEQIWQQIDLQNNFICKEFVSDIAQFLVWKNKLMFGGNDDEDDDDGRSENSEGTGDNKEKFEPIEEEEGNDDAGSENVSIIQSDLNNEDEEEEEDYDDLGDNDDKISSLREKPSIVDDKFFKLREMEQFLEKEENREGYSDEEDDLVDYFADESYNSNDEEEGPKYDDFFDQPDKDSIKKKRKKEKKLESVEDEPIKKKRVKFAVNEEEHDNDDDDDDDGSCGDDLNGFDSEDENDPEIGKNKSEVISTFEARQERLKSRIRALEEEALKEKPWQMKGEVKATVRPQNSLLEEYVEFDTAARPPPVMTEKTTLKLEDIIKQRIKDKVWDDVERKVKPTEDPKEYKKRLVLNQEKSKLSLAQIYEQEYLKQKQAKIENSKDNPDEVPDEHLEIDKMMKSLFSKLDALSNFYFTPKMVTTEVKIVSNVPAITLEEVTPAATSDAKLLAPEEVKSKMIGDLIGKTERTKTDKKRERRLKKKRQQIKHKELEHKEKPKPEQKLKDINRIKQNKKTLKKLKKLGRNVIQLNESGDGKYIRSSSTFFSKLQDEAKSIVKKKTKPTKVIQDKKLDVKKLKL